MSKLSENMKYMRLMRGLSTSDVSNLLECAPNTLTNWEKGRISPPADAVENLCKLYNYSPSEIYGWDKVPEIEEFKRKQGATLAEIKELEKQKALLEKEIAEKRVLAYSEFMKDPQERVAAFKKYQEEQRAKKRRERPQT